MQMVHLSLYSDFFLWTNKWMDLVGIKNFLWTEGRSLYWACDLIDPGRFMINMGDVIRYHFPTLVSTHVFQTCWIHLDQIWHIFGWCPKFTFSTFTPDQNLQNPDLHKTQIYTNSNLHSSDLHTPKFTQSHIGMPKLTQLKFTPNWTQIYTGLNLQRHKFTLCQTTGLQGHCLFWTNQGW